MARKARNLPIARAEQMGTQTPISIQNDTRIYQTALYVRLSVEDSGKDDRKIIENQISLLKEYIKDKPYLNMIDVFKDNGWSGTNFERPGFNRMMEAVKEKRIDCIIVKDLSRFGRNFIETGDYIEKIFPLLGVRLIAVNDGFDTLTMDLSGGLMAPLKNLINDVYAKDISRKVSSALELKMEEGDISGGLTPYGYRKSGRKIEVDQETAKIVRRIFEMRANGKSYHAIARALNAEGILSPSAYRYENGLVHSTRYQGVLWKRHVLNDMLSNRAYLGEVIRGKTKRAIYKGEQLHKVPIEQQKVFPNAHEAIIEEELFQKVQMITNARKNEHLSRLGKYDYLGKEDNLFGKKAVCADCGAILTMYKNVNKYKKVYYNYICPTFVENRDIICFKKNIKKSHLEEAVLETIKLHVSLFVDKKNLLHKMNRKHCAESEKKVMESKLRGLKKQVKRSETFFGGLYVDYKEGLLTESEYLYAKEKYKNEIESLKEEMVSTERRLETYDQQYGENFEIAEAIKTCYCPEKLTKEMVDCFIEKVAVYTDDRVEVTLRYQDEIENLVKICAKRGEAAYG